MKRVNLLTIIFFVCFPFCAFGQRSEARLVYIDKYKDIAIAKMKSHGIPASITLAQGCLESGDGRSDLAVKANNHFGIKCHKDWEGPSYYKKDDDPGKSCFRKYKTVEESFKDHSDFLRYRDRYAFLFDLGVEDYKGWAHGLKKAGYATDPHYAQRLIKIIEDYQLYKYDRLGNNVSGESKVPVHARNVIPPSPSQLEAIRELKPEKSSVWYKYSRSRVLYEKNGVAYVVANEGDTYEMIAKEYNLFKSELLSYNDLKKDINIEPGTVIFLERKKRKAMKHLDYHIAEEGDNFYNLSQRYGVRLDCLLEYNSRKSSDVIYPEEVIHLRKSKK